MRGADSLIPARFLCLLGHVCVLVTLLWEDKKSVSLCLPSQYHHSLLQEYRSRLVAGFGSSLALALVELLTFISGLTMFSPTATLISIGSHGLASVLLTYFILDGWLCDWFWPVFALCSVLPSCVDTASATSNEHQQLTQSNDYKAGWTFYLILAGVATTLGSSLPVGFNIGVVNTPADVIKTFCNESIISRYGVVLNDGWLSILWSSIVSIFIIGGCTGSLLGAVLANGFGRKKATIATSLLSLIGAALFVTSRAANSVEMLLLGRLIVGLAGGLTTSIVPMYLAELAPARLTGALGVACPMGVNVGVLVGQLMGLEGILGGASNWPYLLSVYAILVIVCLPLLMLLPESPKYLYVVRRNEELAIKELSRVRGVSPSLLAPELSLLRGEAGGAAWSVLAVLADKRLRMPLLLVCSMQAGQQTSGINAVFYYSKKMFLAAGLSALHSQYATIACGFINVCTAALMVYLLPRCGRRKLLLGSMTGAVIVLAGLTASMRFMTVFPWMPVVCMAGVLLYVLVYGFGLGPIPYFIASEIFEIGPRPAGMALGSLANWGGNFLVGMSFPTMSEYIGPYSFLVFSAITLAVLVFQKLYFPETRGKTPAQVSQLTSRGFQSRPLQSISRFNHV